MTNRKLYILANSLIYSLMAILIIMIFYNLFGLYKKYTTPKLPENSINVSPKYNDDTFDVLVDN